MDERITPERRRNLNAMLVLRREWTAVAQARLATLARAQALIDAGALTVVQACNCFDIGVSTWHRWARELGLRELAAAAVAEMATALDSAGADEHTSVSAVRSNIDLEMALLAVGGHFRAEE